MQELGIVLALQGTQASVRITRSSACATCGKCGHGLDAPRELIIKARNTVGAAVGDAVRLAVEDVSFLKAAAIVYGVPLGGALTGFFVGNAIRLPSGADLTLPLGGIAFVAALFYVWLYDRRLHAAGKGQAVIVEVFGSSADAQRDCGPVE